MCIPGLATALIGNIGAPTAAAASAAGGFGGLLQGIGTAVSIGGALVQGVQGYRTAKAEARALGEQRRTEAQLTATKDARTRLQFRQAMRRQAGELAARGIQLDSPTAVLLGQTAAQEMSFASQSVRSDGQARDIELSAAQKAARSRASLSLLRGTVGAAGTLLSAAPDLWPELMA